LEITHISKRAVSKQIKERTISFCKENKITQAKLAEVMGTQQSSINRWFSFNTDEILNIFAIHWLVTYHNLNSNWLLTGNGFSKNTETNIIQNAGQNNSNLVQKQTVNQGIADKECKECPLPKAVERLTQQNERLTDKLMEKI